MAKFEQMNVMVPRELLNAWKDWMRRLRQMRRDEKKPHVNDRRYVCGFMSQIMAENDLKKRRERSEALLSACLDWESEASDPNGSDAPVVESLQAKTSTARGSDDIHGTRRNRVTRKVNLPKR